MQGGENLAQIDLHAFTDTEEQKISKEVLALVEAIGDLENLPDVGETITALHKELDEEGGSSEGVSSVPILRAGEWERDEQEQLLAEETEPAFSSSLLPSSATRVLRVSQ